MARGKHKEGKHKEGKHKKGKHKNGSTKRGDASDVEGMDNPLAGTTSALDGTISATSSNGAREMEFDSTDNITMLTPPASPMSNGGEVNLFKENADLMGQVSQWQSKYELAQQKIRRYQETEGLDATEKLNNLETQVDRQDKELDTLRRTLFMESKAHPNAKMRKKTGKVAQEIAAEDPVHVSPNTIRKVQDLAKGSLEEHQGGGPIVFVWAFVFTMPSQPEARLAKEGEDQDEEELYDRNGKPRRDEATDRTLKISHEAWVCCEKIVACDLCFEYVIPIDGRHLIIAVGAGHEVMIDEASAMKVLMRMQETKGSIEFHPDLLRFFNSNHGGLNEYHDGKWSRRAVDGYENHWLPDEKLDDIHLEKRNSETRRIFTSGMQQRIVMNRLKRMGRYIPDRMIQLGSISKPQEKILRDITARAVSKRKDLQASMIDDMLLLFGGYRPQNQSVFPHMNGRPVIAALSKLVVFDDQFLLTPKGLQTLKPSETMVLSYEDIADAINVLERWKLGAGREEVFFGTLERCFPLHMEGELSYLKKEWSSPKLLFRGMIIGYDAEHEPKLHEEGPPKKFSMNTFGSSGNILHEHSFPWSLTYQPLEEIRDYFGDDLGLYFSWIGLYTAMLGVCSMFGVVVQIVQPMYGGVEKNPLTTVYSIYVGLWSISFLETWNRRENELRFLWGTASLSKIEAPRKEFVGVLETNAETGRQVMEHKSRGIYNLKIFCSMVLSMIFIIFTITSAVAAQMVRYVEPVHESGAFCRDIVDAQDETITMDELLNGEYTAGNVPWQIVSVTTDGSGNFSDPLVNSVELQKCYNDGVGCYTTAEMAQMEACNIIALKRFELASACLNLAIIGIYGVIFEALADSLCEWENHRTESEFENSRVTKNFLFQFINNYFVLFYIAYLREIKDPITEAAHPCAGGNCLPELQTQLIVVFTAKTIGKQLAFTAKPFIFKWWAALSANKVTKSIVKKAAKGKALMPESMRNAMEEVVS